ncbi:MULTISPECIES: FadR/GntR family transcriptional regulator [Amycolatopsis]|uniref:FadR/GntR family transcriptional regulator n=1 Tax=Amycolatopsis tucumanensis TaxID=401106 RepID=A0ABP7J9R2_9PSEU|nr:GntR family transcriptional regulator [Amycolatopsis tucumanensis]MCF6421849.1 GntR family transcriptional regulator [Amycolatopsis tucumanensis]
MASQTSATNGRLFQRVVDYVQNAIASGELKPGDRLPSERELVEQFGIGRASVREALRVLENMDLVKSQPRDPRGPLILPLSVEPVRRSIAMLTSGGALGLAELVQFRMIADASANLLAAARRTDEQLLALERNMARMRACMSRGYAEFSQADLEFHELIAEAGGNRLVQVYGDVTREAILKLIQQTILDADDQTALMLQSIRHHRAVFAAISDRDGLLASRLARETLYAYYADHVSPADREIMATLVRECGGRLPS